LFHDGDFISGKRLNKIKKVLELDGAQIPILNNKKTRLS